MPAKKIPPAAARDKTLVRNHPPSKRNTRSLDSELFAHPNSNPNFRSYAEEDSYNAGQAEVERQFEEEKARKRKKR